MALIHRFWHSFSIYENCFSLLSSRHNYYLLNNYIFKAAQIFTKYGAGIFGIVL